MPNRSLEYHEDEGINAAEGHASADDGYSGASPAVTSMQNSNPFVEDLLAWHGEAGGVRVPFRDAGNPLGDSIETHLIRRLRETAATIVDGDPSAPRWIFLVGGPGNGKSEAIQVFVEELERALDMGGAITRALEAQFEEADVPWRAQIGVEDCPEERFRAQVGRLVVVQDASVSLDPQKDAAGSLVELLEELAASSDRHLFVCCVNRGLLARAFAHARAATSAIADFLQQLLTATSLGPSALSDERPPCWPLSSTPLATGEPVAGWPLDMESLFVYGGGEDDTSPPSRIVQFAVDDSRWEIDGRCADCSSKSICPIRQNASWLRGTGPRSALMKVLRHSELVLERRLTFRELFSLSAELLVGQRQDYGVGSPCDWVHERAALLHPNAPADRRLTAISELTSCLYPQRLYPLRWTMAEVLESLTSPVGTELQTIIHGLADDSASNANHIRGHLHSAFAPAFDPADLSPLDPDHPFFALENSYGQSVRSGNKAWPDDCQPSELESLFLDVIQGLESSCDQMARESAKVKTVLLYLKLIGSSLAKRSVGSRTGHHLVEDLAAEYEATIRDPERLDGVVHELRTLIGNHFDVLHSFGQPADLADPIIQAASTTVLIREVAPAPSPSPHLPGHDFPSIVLKHGGGGGNDGARVPMTFALFQAIKDQASGCGAASLPVSARASLDHIRMLVSGQLVRDFPNIKVGEVTISVGESYRLRPGAQASPPTLETR